jgi:hypothetical protein
VTLGLCATSSAAGQISFYPGLCIQRLREPLWEGALRDFPAGGAPPRIQEEAKGGRGRSVLGSGESRSRGLLRPENGQKELHGSTIRTQLDTT